MTEKGWRERWFGGTSDLLSVQPLRMRIGAGLVGQQDARTHLDNLVLHSSLTGTKVWTASSSLQTAALGWWMMQLLWDATNVFVEAQALESEDSKVSREAYAVGEQLCTLAETTSVSAIRNHSQAEVDLHLPPPKLYSFLQLPIMPSTCAGVWAVYETIYAKVQGDMRKIMDAQIPKRFQPVLKQLIQAISPSVALHEHYQGQWLIAMTPESKVRIVQEAEEGIKTLFVAGQKLWAPYLLGSVYQQCLNAPQTLDDLELSFDPWILTDPAIRSTHRKSPESEASITAFWAQNPNPGLSYQLQMQIIAAHNKRQVRHVTGGHFPYCPWTSMWLVWRDVELGGVHFDAGTYIALYTGRDANGSFVSEVRSVGRFILSIKRC